MAQVYRATLRADDGTARDVVVKVQRTGLSDTIAVDRAAIMQLARLVQRRTPLGLSVQPEDLALEFVESVEEELDFTLEARNGLELAAGLDGIDGIRVPVVHLERSTTRVLTEEYVSAPSVVDEAALAALDVSSAELAERLISLGELSACVAHEIRNPLGAISHAAQLLEEAPNLEEADARLLDIIHTHTQRVNNIIETILELSRKRPAQIETITIRELINRILQERELQTKMDKDNIHVKELSTLAIEIDINQVKQVLHNIIDNGLRYSEQHTGKRTLTISAGKIAETGQTYLEIEDQGPGVPEDQVKHLFEPFFTTENSGTGLGLYIAKELCEANRLQLSYNGDNDGGCFRIAFSHTIAKDLTTHHRN